MNMKDKILLCAISSVTSGACEEDCAFCAQSARYRATIDVFRQKDIKTVVDEAKKAKASGALGFCLVTAGAALDDDKIEYVANLASAVKKAVDGLFIIACNGIATLEALKELKKAGVDSYNHNLETAKSHYDKICSTHSWDERFSTCENVKKANLMLCSGGVFGIGENALQRAEFLTTLATLKPQTVPLNFYHPNPALPLPNKTINIEEAFAIIKTAKIALPESLLMAAGGREVTFGARQKELFDAGIGAIVIGDYLTTHGEGMNATLSLLKESGLESLLECPFHI
jgi:biotin synthase